MITNNVDLIVEYDSDHLVATTRVFLASAPAAKEHAGQCCMIEHIREILASGITLEDWNSTAEPWMFQELTWDEWWAGITTRAHNRACLNVAAQVPQLTAGERTSTATMAQNFFEQGYAAVMAATPQADKMTFTRTGGL